MTQLNSNHFYVLLLLFLLTISENVYLVAETREAQLNEIIVSSDRVVWYYETLTTSSMRPLSLNTTLDLGNNMVILRCIKYINASTKVETQLKYYVKLQGQTIDVNFLIMLQLSIGELLLREMLTSKIIIANKSIKVQLHSYEIEAPSAYVLINTPMERDVSSRFMLLVHSLGYHYITNAISLLKISMSTKGVLVRYSAFNINIDINKYIKWLSNSRSVSCRFINSTTMLTLNTSNIVLYYTTTHRTSAAHTPLAQGIDLSDTIECLAPLIESLNNIALLLLTSVLNTAQISKTTLIDVMSTMKYIAKVYKLLNDKSTSTRPALYYSIDVHDKHLKIRCVIAGSILYNSTKVLKLLTTIHSYIVNSTILKSVDDLLDPYLPMFADVKYYNNSVNVSNTIRSSIRLVTLAYPALNKAVVFLTVILISIQVAIVLYVFVKAIKNR